MTKNQAISELKRAADAGATCPDCGDTCPPGRGCDDPAGCGRWQELIEVVAKSCGAQTEREWFGGIEDTGTAVLRAELAKHGLVLPAQE